MTSSAASNASAIARPVLRSSADALRALVIVAGLSWSAVFVILALRYELQLYADGAMFSYAVAAQDVWAFHWHNLSGRLSVFFLSLWPAELYVGLTGSPWSGIVLYALLFYVTPLIGLIGTFVADRSNGRIIFVYACCSTALLCPLVFGFPTEMWVAHALFWPALAVSHYAGRSIGGTALLFTMLLTLAFTHEGALVLAFAIVATHAPRSLRDTSFLRAAGVLLAVLVVWAGVKVIFPPGDYFAEVLVRAALHFFDLSIFQAKPLLLSFAALTGYAFFFCVLSRRAPEKAHVSAAAIVSVILAVYWIWFDHAVHASDRYYMRTALVIVTPVLGALAALYVMHADGLTSPTWVLQRMLEALASVVTVRILAGGFLLVTLVHAVETARFVAAWTNYKAAVKALATGTASDPALGDPRFVSSDRISADLNRLAWFSTTQYLSVIVTDFTPSRVVIDPKNNYFWLSCRTATANFDATRAVPATTRDLVRVYACMHRLGELGMPIGALRSNRVISAIFLLPESLSAH